eukprot:g9073.t1
MNRPRGELLDSLRQKIKVLRGFGTNLKKIKVLREFGTNRKKIKVVRGFGTNRKKIKVFRGFGSLETVVRILSMFCALEIAAATGSKGKNGGDVEPIVVELCDGESCIALEVASLAFFVASLGGCVAACTRLYNWSGTARFMATVLSPPPL